MEARKILTSSLPLPVVHLINKTASKNNADQKLQNQNFQIDLLILWIISILTKTTVIMVQKNLNNLLKIQSNSHRDPTLPSHHPIVIIKEVGRPLYTLFTVGPIDSISLDPERPNTCRYQGNEINKKEIILLNEAISRPKKLNKNCFELNSKYGTFKLTTIDALEVAFSGQRNSTPPLPTILKLNKKTVNNEAQLLLKMMTLNTTSAKVKQRRAPYARFMALLVFMINKKLDVIALQESVMSIEHLITYAQTTAQPSRFAQDEQSGMLELPNGLTACYRQHSPSCRGLVTVIQSSLKPTIVYSSDEILAVTISSPQADVLVLNTYINPKLLLSQTRSLTRIRTAINQLAQNYPSHLITLMGDLNLDSNDVKLKVVQPLDKLGARKWVHGINNRSTFESVISTIQDSAELQLKQRCIDHVIISAMPNVRVDLRVMEKDEIDFCQTQHRSIMTTISLTSRTTRPTTTQPPQPIQIPPLPVDDQGFEQMHPIAHFPNLLKFITRQSTTRKLLNRAPVIAMNQSFRDLARKWPELIKQCENDETMGECVNEMATELINTFYTVIDKHLSGELAMRKHLISRGRKASRAASLYTKCVNVHHQLTAMGQGGHLRGLTAKESHLISTSLLLHNYHSIIDNAKDEMKMNVVKLMTSMQSDSERFNIKEAHDNCKQFIEMKSGRSSPTRADDDKHAPVRKADGELTVNNREKAEAFAAGHLKLQKAWKDDNVKFDHLVETHRFPAQTPPQQRRITQLDYDRIKEVYNEEERSEFKDIRMHDKVTAWLNANYWDDRQCKLSTDGDSNNTPQHITPVANQEDLFKITKSMITATLIKMPSFTDTGFDFVPVAVLKSACVCTCKMTSDNRCQRWKRKRKYQEQRNYEGFGDQIARNTTFCAPSDWKIGHVGHKFTSILSQIPCENNPVLHLLFLLYKFCLQHAVIPSIWRVSRVTMLPKKEDLKLITNHRPITLMTNTQKVLDSILNQAMVDNLVKNPLFDKSQIAYLKKRERFEGPVPVMERVSQNELNNSNTIITFYDIVKAFDCIEPKDINAALCHLGIPLNIRQYFGEMYEMNFLTVKCGKDFSLPFEQTIGIRQGDPASPTLFSMVLNHVLANWYQADHPLKERQKLYGTHLVAYADDTAQISTSAGLHVQATRHVIRSKQTVHLAINEEKTVTMIFGKRVIPDTPDVTLITLGGLLAHKFKQVNQVPYLGVKLNDENDPIKMIPRDVSDSMFQYSGILLDPEIPIALKGLVLRQVWFPKAFFNAPIFGLILLGAKKPRERVLVSGLTKTQEICWERVSGSVDKSVRRVMMKQQHARSVTTIVQFSSLQLAKADVFCISQAFRFLSKVIINQDEISPFMKFTLDQVEVRRPTFIQTFLQNIRNRFENYKIIPEFIDVPELYQLNGKDVSTGQPITSLNLLALLPEPLLEYLESKTASQVPKADRTIKWMGEIHTLGMQNLSPHQFPRNNDRNRRHVSLLTDILYHDIYLNDLKTEKSSTFFYVINQVGKTEKMYHAAQWARPDLVDGWNLLTAMRTNSYRPLKHKKGQNGSEEVPILCPFCANQLMTNVHVMIDCEKLDWSRKKACDQTRLFFNSHYLLGTIFRVVTKHSVTKHKAEVLKDSLLKDFPLSNFDKEEERLIEDPVSLHSKLLRSSIGLSSLDHILESPRGYSDEETIQILLETREKLEERKNCTKLSPLLCQKYLTFLKMSYEAKSTQHAQTVFKSSLSSQDLKKMFEKKVEKMIALQNEFCYSQTMFLYIYQAQYLDNIADLL